MTAVATRKLNALTSLRFVAAALIVLHHSRGLFGIPSDVASPLQLDQAVSFFFVLSGFVLTYAYPTLEKVGVRGFLVARIARIWPAHVAALALLFLLQPSPWRTLQTSGLAALVANVLMVHAWIPVGRFFFSFNSPSWSISTELGFYLAFTWLIRSWERTWATKLASAFMLVVCIVGLLNVLQLPSSAYSDGLAAGLVYVSPLGRLFEFTLGMATAAVWLKTAPRIRTGMMVGTAIEVAALGAVALGMYLTAAFTTDSGSLFAWVGAAGALWLDHGGFPCAAFAALIFVMALERGAVSRWLSSPLPVLLGEISYSVYLVHQLLQAYYRDHLRSFLFVPGWAAYAAFWLMLLLIAHLMWLVVERPSRRAIVARWGSRVSGDSRSRRDPRDNAWPCIRLEASLLFSLCLAVVYVAHFRSTVVPIGQKLAERLVSQGPDEARDVRFEDSIELVGMHLDEDGSSQQLYLFWQSEKKQRLRHTAVVHFLGADGAILSSADYPLDPAASEVEAGTTWADPVPVSPQTLSSAQAIGIAVYLGGPEALLRANSGPRDWDGHRLIVPKVSLRHRPTRRSEVGDIRSALQCLYRFDEGSGSSLADASGRGRTGTLTNVQWAAGRAGEGVRASADSGGLGYVRVAASDDFDALREGSIAFWVKLDAGTGPGLTPVLFRARPNVDADACTFVSSLFLWIDGADADAYTLNVAMGDLQGALALHATLPVPDPTTAWHHYVFESDANGNRMFVDGQLRTATYTNGDAWTEAFLAQTSDGVTGYSIAGDNCTDASDNMLGVMDDFRIYDVALRATDIAMVMNEAAQAPRQPN